MKRHWLLAAIVALALLLPASLLLVLTSPSGSLWLIQKALPLLPATSGVIEVQGRFLSKLHIADFNYQTNALTIAFKQLDLSWHPDQLLHRKLWVSDLVIDGLTIQLSGSKSTEKPFDFTKKLVLPVDVQLDNLLLTNMEITSGSNSTQKVQKLQLSLNSEADQLKINQLLVNAEPVQATLHGQIKLGSNFPLTLNADWQVQLAERGQWQGQATVSGDLQQLTITSQLAAPFKFALKGQVTDLLQQAKLAVHGDWQSLQWPITGTPQLNSAKGSIDLTGALDNYRLNVNAQLSQPYLPKASLLLDSQGSLQGLQIKKLDIDSSTGLFTLTGKLAWQNVFAFDLAATGKNFNPGLLVPQIPGDLTFTSHVQGQLAEPISLNAEINRLSGQLRGYPVAADGKFALTGQLLQIDALNITSGKNLLAVNGKLSQAQSALDVNLNAPNLASAWPTLTGNLQAKAHVQGSLEKPVITLQAKGKQLGFAGSKLSELAMDIALDANKNSTISMLADNLQSGALLLQKLQISGQGTPLQHAVKLALTSNQGNLNTDLTGKYLTGVWTGQLKQLDLNRSDIGLWQLQKPFSLTVQKEFKVQTAPLCLHHQSAAICAKGMVAGKQEFQINAQATNLPTLTFKSFFPKDVSIASIVNAELKLQQKQGTRTGDYQLQTTPITVTVPGNRQPMQLALGSAKASGTIKNNNVAADIELALTGSDFARAQLQYDLAKQAVSGHINASVQQFAFVQAFVPQLTNISGQASANLSIKGQLPMPEINGQLTLNNGEITLQNAGLNLKNITVHAEAIDQSIRLQASVAPALLKESEYYQELQFQNQVKLNADLKRHKNHYTGEYRLDTPAGSLRLLQPVNKPLGAMYVIGHVNDEKHVVDVNANLVDNDFIRAGIELGNSHDQPLSGHIIASLNQFGLLNPFVPQLSDLKGSLNANMAVSGTLQKPLASGSVNLTNTSFNINELGTHVSEVKLQAQVVGAENPHILVNGFAKSGNGNISLNGLIDLQKQAAQTVNLHLTGSNFEAAKSPEAQVELTPDLTLLVTSGKGKVTGSLKIPKATIVMQELPENAVTVSKDEIILGKETVDKNDNFTNAIDADVSIELGKQVSFSGQGLKSNLTGKINVTKNGANTAMHGEITMEKARYKSYGQDLTVRKGRFVFNGPIDNPFLEVEAIRVSNDKKVTATLAVSGQLKSPKTQVSADPTMPETDALAYLVTGKSLSQVSKSENNVLAGAALSYGAGKASWLTSKLGIDEFEIEQGATLQDSLVSVGQYLSPDFYVGTKVGLFNKQASVILKYVIRPGLNVETQTGSSKRVKINYETDRD